MGVEYANEKFSKEILQLVNYPTHKKIKVFERIDHDFKKFLSTASADWNDEQKMFRRFSVFGNSVNCIRWGEEFLISGPDIVKAVKNLCLISSLGINVNDRRGLEEGILNDIRSLQKSINSRLEPAKSDLINFMYHISAAKTLKRQKVYHWDSIPFMYLFEEARKREFLSKGQDSFPNVGLNDSFENLTVLATAVEKSLETFGTGGHAIEFKCVQKKT